MWLIPICDVLRAEDGLNSLCCISTDVILLVIHIEVLLIIWRPIVVNFSVTRHAMVNSHHERWDEVSLTDDVAFMIIIRAEVNCRRRLVVCREENESSHLEQDEQDGDHRDD